MINFNFCSIILPWITVRFFINSQLAFLRQFHFYLSSSCGELKMSIPTNYLIDNNFIPILSWLYLFKLISWAVSVDFLSKIFSFNKFLFDLLFPKWVKMLKINETSYSSQNLTVSLVKFAIENHKKLGTISNYSFILSTIFYFNL